ncbi:MAG TPA: methyltransferase domain-containing protein [Jatrophihabitans sp.]|jgi:SAM-dependent methyltransferase|nr:methyltransferase domain-containing protein [Jatrophihabitans sp.]
MTESTSDAYALRLSEAEIARYAMMAELARAAEADLWQTAGIVSGAAVADVGCGPGALFPALVAAVGEQGSVTAVDGDPDAVAQARALAVASGWGQVRVQVGRADATGLDPGAADAAIMRHVLAHNGPTEQAIVDHVATLVRPGGCVYLVDIFGPGFGFRPHDDDVDALNDAYSRYHAAKGNDLLTGLRLDVLLENAGLEVIAFRGWYNIAKPRGDIRPPAWAARQAMVDAGVATDDDFARWGAALDALAAQSPTVFAPLFGAVGRRPG